eukprot:g3521.t1
MKQRGKKKTVKRHKKKKSVKKREEGINEDSNVTRDHCNDPEIEDLSISSMLEESLESETPELSLAVLLTKADLKEAQKVSSVEVATSAACNVQRIVRGNIARNRVNLVRDQARRKRVESLAKNAEIDERVKAELEAAAKAKIEAEAAARAKAEAEAAARAKAEAEAAARAKAEAEAAARAKAEEEAAARAKAEAEAAARAKAEAEAAARAKAEAEAEAAARAKAEVEAAAKAQEDARLAEELLNQAKEHAAMQEEMLAMIHQSNGEKDENRMLNESFDEDETSSEESVRTKYNLGFVSENPQDVSRGSTVGDENFSDLTEDDDENDMRILAPSFHDRQQIHVHHHHHYHHASNDEAQDTSNVKYNTSNKRKRPLGLKSPPRGREDVLHGAYAPTSTSSAIGGGSGHQDHSQEAGKYKAEKKRRHDRRRAERHRRHRARRMKNMQEKAREAMQREHDELYESNFYSEVPIQLWLGGKRQNAGAFFGKRKQKAREKKSNYNRPGRRAGIVAGTKTATAQSFSSNASQLSQSLPQLPRLLWKKAEREKGEHESREVLKGQHLWRKRVDSLLAKYHY